MKKTFSLIFVLAAASLLFSLNSCTKKSSSSGDLLSNIQKKGEITIATEGTWAPWTYHDKNNELTGFDIEVGMAIAESLGVKANFVEVDWDGIFAGIDAKRYDIALNGVNVTEERSKKYDFCTPYAYSSTAVIVDKDNNSISSFEDLNGKSTANSIGSIYAELAERYGAKVTTIDSFDETLELVKHGRIDATLNDTVTFYYYQKVQPDNNFKMAFVAQDAEKVAIPVRKGKETASLVEAVNNAIAQMVESGQLSELSKKYFGEDISRE